MYHRCLYGIWVFIFFSFLKVGHITSLIKFSNVKIEDAFLVSSVLGNNHVVKALSIFRDVLKENGEKENKTSQCLLDVESTLDGVKQGRIGALKFIDASSKIPSGLLEGNLNDLGNYDECLNVSTSDIQRQYCLVSVTVLLNSRSNIGRKEIDDALSGSLQLTLAWCLPKICRIEEIKLALEGLTENVGQIVPAVNNITFRVNPTDCHVKEDVPFNVMEWLAIITFLTLCCTTVLSTVFDWVKETQGSQNCYDISNKDKLLSSFSVLTNGRRLLNTCTTSETFPVLNCLKVLSIFWVVVGHQYAFMAGLPLTNNSEMPNFLKYVGNMLLLNAPLSVDVFFVISGLLTAYGYLRLGYCSGITRQTHILYLVHRYLRLTPAFAIMMLFTVTLLYRLGDGPMWDRIVGLAKQDCVSYWWSGLVYISNYYNPENICMMQSWYLAADMQLYLFAPLVLYPLLKWPRWGLVLVAICVVFSVVIPFYVAFVEEIQAPIPVLENTERSKMERETLYLPTHTRTLSYVMGILLGFILFQIKVKKAVFKLKKSTNIIIWIVAVMLLVTSLFGCYPFFQLDATYNKWTSSLYIGFYKLGWSLGICWIILACSTGHGGIVNTFVSWSIFAPLGRLTYCVFLVHVSVIVVGLGGIRNQQYFEHYNILTSSFGVFAISIFFATALTIVTESPVMVIEKIIIPREPRQN